MKIHHQQQQQHQTPQIKAINELNELGRSLMEKSLNDPKTPLNAAVSQLGSQSQAQSLNKNLSLNEIQLQKTNNNSNSNSNFQNNHVNVVESTTTNTTTTTSDLSFNALNTLFVKLEDIKPSSVAPMNLYEKNSLKIVLHFARDSPSPNIHVVVISVTSSNANNSLRNFSFQAAVPKVK
jgi:hypothetical protein